MTNAALSPTMTLRDFQNGYWYQVQLRDFADCIGIPGAKKLRKDELEKAIALVLRTGDAVVPTKRSLRRTGVKDVERGLSLTSSPNSTPPIERRRVPRQSPRGKKSKSSTSPKTMRPGSRRERRAAFDFVEQTARQVDLRRLQPVDLVFLDGDADPESLLRQVLRFGLHR